MRSKCHPEQSEGSRFFAEFTLRLFTSFIYESNVKSPVR